MADDEDNVAPITPRNDADPIQPRKPDSERVPDKPLSDGPVTEVKLPGNAGTIRLDAQGRILCKAKRRDGELCKSPSMAGARVCRMHGGSIPGARQAAQLRLADAVQPSIAKLISLMGRGTSENVQLRAADSLLDRAGFGRSQVIEGADAKELLYQRLLAAQAEEIGTATDDPDPSYPDPDSPYSPTQP